MKKLFRKLSHLFLRHPMLYFIRYLLLSKNAQQKRAEEIGCFNDINRIDEIPKLFFEVNSQISLQPEMGSFNKALEIARYLKSKIKGGSGLGLPSEKTLEKMLSGQGGVCSDFAQIFNVFCLINNIQVKEWGCVDRLYKTQYGHSFNEIYADELQKWVAIDIHKAIMFRDDSNCLLSAVELFSYLRKGGKLRLDFYSAFIPIKLYRIKLIYSRKTIPFVIDNYRNKVNDHFFNKYKKFPPFVINAIMILFRKNHQFIFVMDNYKAKLLPGSLQNLALPAFF